MKRFDFPLERVRQWRETQVDLEHTRLRRLFEEMRQLKLAAARLLSLVAEAEQVIEKAACAKQAVEARQLANLDNYRLYVKREEQLLAAQQEELRNRIAEQRERLVNARRNFRLLEKLKERRFQEWERDYNREAENLASDLHLAKWNRRQPQSERL